MNKRTFWIRSPAYDLLFFSTAWVIPIFLFSFRSIEAAVGATMLAAVYHLLLRHPHFMATAYATYLKPANRAYYRENWLPYLVIPVVIFLVYATHNANAFGLKDTVVDKALTVIALTWGFQHIAFQNYGILSIYRGRAKTAADLIGRKLEKFVFYALFADYVVPQVLKMTMIDGVADKTIVTINIVLKCFLILSLFTYATRTWFVRKKYPISLPLALFFLSGVLSMVYWPFYETMGNSSLDGPTIFFYVFNGHHCLAYLGLIFLMESNRKRLVSPTAVFSAGSWQYLKFIGPLIVASALIMVIGTNRGIGWISNTFGLAGITPFDFFQGFFVVHYYLESLSWKLSKPHYRQHTVPLLRFPHAEAQVSTTTSAS